MSSPTPRPRRRAIGATSIGKEGRRRRPLWWLLPLVVAVAAVVLLLLLLSRCGDDDTPKVTNQTSQGAASAAAAQPSTAPSVAPVAPSAPASEAAAPSGSVAPVEPSTSPSATPAAGAAPAVSATPSGAATAGTIVTTGVAVLGDGPVKALSPYTGKTAVATRVRVQSVPADEGFWVGTSTTDRFWVQLTGKAGESPYQVKAGDTVDFTGTVTPAPAGFAARVGVDAREGAAQLTRQKQYLAVPKASVSLSR